MTDFRRGMGSVQIRGNSFHAHWREDGKQKAKAFPSEGAAWKFLKNRLEPQIAHLKEYRAWEYPPCIYFLFQNGELVYIGQSTDLHGRIRQHKKRIGEQFDKVLYLEIDPIMMNEAEKTYIKHFRPPLNKVFNEYKIRAAIHSAAAKLRDTKE